MYSSVPCRLVARWLIFGLIGSSSLFACTESKSRLEAQSAVIETKAVEARKDMQAALPAYPSPKTLPEGVPQPVWSAIHWIPPSAIGVNGTPPGQAPFIVKWAFSQGGADDPSCVAIEHAGVVGYGIEWEQPSQSFVLFSAASLEQVDACAAAITKSLGATATLHDGVLDLAHPVLGSTTLRFAQRGDELVMIVDDGRLGDVVEAQPDQLASNAGLVELLGHTGNLGDGWSISTRDMTSVPLGEPSKGNVASFDLDDSTLELQLFFVDEASAERALSAAAPFVKDAESLLDVSLGAAFHREGATIEASVSLKAISSLPPEKLEAMTRKLQGRAEPSG